jgi:hypothetical protein
MILCIDPGLRGCGAALFADTQLQWAVYVKNPVIEGRGYATHAALGDAVRRAYAERQPLPPFLTIIEHPVVYPGMPQTDLNDLLDVVAVGAAVACQFKGVSSVTPSQWKGQVKKSVMLERIRDKLTPAELRACAFTNKSDNEDLIDAVGIGLWHHKRLNQKTFPGATP